MALPWTVQTFQPHTPRETPPLPCNTTERGSISYTVLRAHGVVVSCHTTPVAGFNYPDTNG